ncbi:MAG: PhzA/PhzB family protein [Phenylobacterium sp.]|uniref:nuclear transport factor 2 family protein n=1 Tax=Phenylobacterium sp. TaxID=1871053 RepID=UPI001A418A74|nr:nuclear transport factor 2 family protein [Phenylobacterium sp.]MBL8773571.1 PhzA/PhzB family protein [Phenylobacterium sp.]
MARKTIGDAFGGKVTTLEEQRAIWAEALHEDAIWESPVFERPIQVIGRQATGRFFELLLSVVPQFSTTLVAAYPTRDPDTTIIESHGGGPTVDGGRYTQRYFSLITQKDGLAFRMREYCNPFQTYKAYGKARWEAAVDEIMRGNAPWPASQAPDPISLPPTV